MLKFLYCILALFATLTVFGQENDNIQDRMACEYARTKKTAKVWQDYLKQFPNGMCSFEAKSELDEIGGVSNVGESAVDKVSVGVTEVNGAVDSASVTTIIKSGSPAVKRCYDKALLSNPNLKGKISVTILINGKGRVESIDILEDTLKNVDITRCVKGIFSRLRFPKSDRDSTKITFNLDFN